MSARTVDYYTRQGLLAPVERSPGRQRYYDDNAVQRLLLIKELQAERLTLREIMARLAIVNAPVTATSLAGEMRRLEGELDRLNREVAGLTTQLEQSELGSDRQTISQVAALALAKALTLAQWLTIVMQQKSGRAGSLNRG